KPLCTSQTSKVFAPGTMARGLQYLQVQAECGDRVGAPLVMHWYGVPDGYRYMAVSAIAVNDASNNRKRHIFSLVRPSDCPTNMLTVLCRTQPGSEYRVCSENYVDNPRPGFSVLPVCKGIQYPPYEITN